MTALLLFPLLLLFSSWLLPFKWSDAIFSPLPPPPSALYSLFSPHHQQQHPVLLSHICSRLARSFFDASAWFCNRKNHGTCNNSPHPQVIIFSLPVESLKFDSFSLFTTHSNLLCLLCEYGLSRSVPVIISLSLLPLLRYRHFFPSSAIVCANERK